MNYKNKSTSQLKTIADKHFNEFIRNRDRDKSCISCNKPSTLEAGHYYPKKGYDGLRYDEINVNGECPICNRCDENHLVGYQENLILRIGQNEYKKLEQRAANYKKNHLFKWSKSDLIDIISTYIKKKKEYK